MLIFLGYLLSFIVSLSFCLIMAIIEDREPRKRYRMKKEQPILTIEEIKVRDAAKDLIQSYLGRFDSMWNIHWRIIYWRFIFSEKLYDS